MNESLNCLANMAANEMEIMAALHPLIKSNFAAKIAWEEAFDNYMEISMKADKLYGEKEAKKAIATEFQSRIK